MLQKLIQRVSPAKSVQECIPVKPDFFRDPQIADALHHKGYFVADLLEEREINLLGDLYKKHYINKDTDGKGSFFGVISEQIFDSINEILKAPYDRWFINYKNIVNAFVAKTPGKASTRPIHQDWAMTDETQHSNITAWIPLQDIDAINGAVHLIPRTHYIFDTYRCATSEPITKNIEEELYPYFVPIYMRLGQVLFLDSRLFHYSPPNLSDKTRISVICRICSSEADIITYYREKSGKDHKIEMWRCPDNFYKYDKNHLDDIRPEGCQFLGYRHSTIQPLTIAEFERKKKVLGILKP